MQSYTSGKEVIKWFIEYHLPETGGRVLDLGYGTGIYGRLLTKPCYKVGVDVVDRVEKYELKNVYDEFHHEDVRTEFINALGYFDAVILGDLIEHLTAEDTLNLLILLKQMTPFIVMSVRYEATTKSQMPYEQIRQGDLTPDVMKTRYPEFDLYAYYMSKDARCKPRYGYYVWDANRQQA